MTPFVIGMDSLLQQTLELAGKCEVLAGSLPQVELPEGGVRLDMHAVGSLHTGISFGGMVANAYFDILGDIIRFRTITAECRKNIVEAIEEGQKTLLALQRALSDLQTVLDVEQHVVVPFGDDGKPIGGKN